MTPLMSPLTTSPDDIMHLPMSKEPPVGHTWHHHQDVGRMQLITRSAHDLAMPHTGGMSIWGGGYKAP
ncbi:MAG TPA: HNH endonuclease [Archangium sp.]|uniref:HNH endonuclease signature motif containing protein n=1 Tax=Archangium sp. TaxID=1872627 RepID=UPI002E32155D|nr:HNH endonuclease [Archangium sp.]HEX5750312.1 HNH endonuclease [Archangium sp.]